MSRRLGHGMGNSHTTKHVWTSEDRELLAVLHKFYDISSREMRSLFNNIYKDRLRREGFPRGLKATTIVSQIADMKRTNRGGVFNDIQSLTQSAILKKFRKLISDIEIAAGDVKVHLKRKDNEISAADHVQESRSLANTNDWETDSTDDSIDVLDDRRGRCTISKRTRVTTPSSAEASVRRSSMRGETTTPFTCSVSPSETASTISSESEGSYQPEPEADNHDPYLHIDHLNDFENSATRINPQLRIHFNNKGNSAHSRPRLLWRAGDPAHNLRAREFLNPDTPISRPPTDKSAFLQLANQHLHVDKTFLSPFLSWTESARRALKLVSDSRDVPLQIYIVDFNVLEEEQECRYGARKAIWLVPNLCDEYGLNLPGGYVGYGEVRLSTLRDLISILTSHSFSPGVQSSARQLES